MTVSLPGASAPRVATASASPKIPTASPILEGAVVDPLPCRRSSRTRKLTRTAKDSSLVATLSSFSASFVSSSAIEVDGSSTLVSDDDYVVSLSSATPLSSSNGMLSDSDCSGLLNPSTWLSDDLSTLEIPSKVSCESGSDSTVLSTEQLSNVGLWHVGYCGEVVPWWLESWWMRPLPGWRGVKFKDSLWWLFPFQGFQGMRFKVGVPWWLEFRWQRPYQGFQGIKFKVGFFLLILLKSLSIVVVMGPLAASVFGVFTPLLRLVICEGERGCSSRRTDFAVGYQDGYFPRVSRSASGLYFTRFVIDGSRFSSVGSRRVGVVPWWIEFWRQRPFQGIKFKVGFFLLILLKSLSIVVVVGPLAAPVFGVFTPLLRLVICEGDRGCSPRRSDFAVGYQDGLFPRVSRVASRLSFTRFVIDGSRLSSVVSRPIIVGVAVGCDPKWIVS